MKLLILLIASALFFGCSYTPPNYSAMLIKDKRPSNTIQGNIGISGTNIGINLQKPNASDTASLEEYPKKTFTQSLVSLDYFINTRTFHFAPNISNTNASLGIGFDYKDFFLFMVTPGVHILNNNVPTNLDFVDDPFINFHASLNISGSKGTVILVSNDVFKSQFLITSKTHDFSHTITPYMNKLALSLLFYDKLLLAGLEVSFINSYDFNYYGGGVMFTFGFR